MTANYILGALFAGFIAACIGRQWFAAIVCMGLMCGLIATLAGVLHS